MNTRRPDNDCKAALKKASPFEALVPNVETIAAMKEARRGKLPSFETADELMADLNTEN